jgi:hypothetical protein
VQPVTSYDAAVPTDRVHVIGRERFPVPDPLEA